MTGRGSAVLGVLAIAVIAWLAWWLAGDAASDAGQEMDAAPARPAVETTTDEHAGVPPRALSNLFGRSAADIEALNVAETPPTQAPPDKAVLLLTVLRAEDDAPIADLDLLVWVWKDVRGNTMFGESVSTATDGTARVEFPFAVQLHKIEAPPSNDHGFVREESSLAIALGEAQHLVVRSRVGATVRGRVVDEQDTPVPGAGVLAWAGHHMELNSGNGPLPKPQLSARCDANGHFELRGVGRELALMPEVEGLAAVGGTEVDLGFAGDSDEAEVADGTVIEHVTLVVGAGVVLRGRAMDPDGQPVPQLWVQAGYVSYSSAGSRVAPMRPLKSGGYTDASGAFAIGPIAPKKWWVSVSDARYRPWGELITPGDSELLIQLEAGCVLGGMVYGADGAPLDGALVTLQGASEAKDLDAGGSTWAKTQAGRFAFGSLVPTKTAALGVSAAGHAIHVIAPLVISETPGAPLELRLDAERLIAGRVVDQHDQPVAGAAVLVRGDRELTTRPWSGHTWEQWIRPGARYTTSGDDGGFRLDRLYDGAFELTVVDPHHEGLEQRLELRSGVEDLLVHLDPAQMRRAVLRGTVRDGSSGEAIDDFEIVLLPAEPERQHEGMMLPSQEFRDAHGEFLMEGLEPGLWTLTASAEGRARAALYELQLRDGEQRVEVTLLPARTLRLRVVDQDRAPVSDISVSFEDAQGARIELPEQPAGAGTLGKTDAAGELNAKGVPADRITVILKVPLVPRAAVGMRQLRFPIDLRVQPEGVQELTIERQRARCLVLSLNLVEQTAMPPELVFDTDDPAAMESLMPLAQSEALKPVEAPVVVTITAADGALVDTARCEPNAQLADAWLVSSSVTESEDEPTSWLAAALPASDSTVLISAEGYEPVTLALPAGEGHVKRLVILKPQ